VGGACSFFKTTGGFVNVTGSFTIGNVAEGQYVIQVSGSAGDSAQAVFNVTAGAFIQLGVNGIFAKVGQVASGPIGTHVSIEGSQFLPNDALNSATCSIGSTSNGNAISNGACSFFKTTSGFVNVTGSFVVGNVPEGQYVVRVSGSAGDSAQAVFNVTAGAFIQLGVNGIFVQVGQVANGPTGTHVSIEGSQFLANDAFNSATCSIGSPTSGSVVTGAACSFFKTTGGFVNATGSFIVGNVNPGQYVIRVSGSAGDSAQAIFNVTRGPQLILVPAKGPTGIHVSIEGGFFLPSDTTCSLSSPSSGSFIRSSSAACSMFTTLTGQRNVTGSFIVGNVPEGQYVVQVTGNQGDFAQAIFNVTTGAFIQLIPSMGPTGTDVKIEGSYFLATDTTCSISSPSSGNIIRDAGCSTFKVSSGTFLGFMNVTGSFIAGNVPIGQYVIQVSGNQGDFAQAIFNVTRGPQLILIPAKGPTGIHVTIEGGFFLPTDTTCSISSPSSGSFIAPSSAGCAVFTTVSGFTNVTGSFIVGNVPEGQYVVQVTGNQGDFAQAIFNVTTGAFIQLIPFKGPDGTQVTVEGSYFLSTDTTCSLSSPTTSSIIQGGACTTFKVTSGTFLGFRNVTGSFIVGNVAPGEYVIQVSGNQGDFAQAIFNVTTGPFIQLGVNVGGKVVFSKVGQTTSGPIGTSVDVEGSYFLSRITSCTISSPTSGSIITGAGCSTFIPSSGTFFGFGNVTGSFIVGNALPGQYVIQVTGNEGSFAQAIFNVTTGPRITLTSTVVGSPRPGISVNVNGTGFLPTDQSCTISSPGSAAVITGSAACAKRVDNTTISGSFIVGNVLPGQYVIEVTGCQGNNGCTPSVGDFAQAVLNVTGGPKLTLSPGSGIIGSSILVNGSGFLTTDQSCSISSISSPNPILSGSSACVTTVGTGITSGSFIIGNVAPGEYVIEVTGCAGNNGCQPSVGDFAQAVLTVSSTVGTLTLSSTNATNGATITFRATGLSVSDTGCTVNAFVLTTFGGGAGRYDTPSNTLITSPTCSIVSPQTAVGSFVVGPYATTDHQYNVTVLGSPVNDLVPVTLSPTYPYLYAAFFNVTASVVVTPTSGTIHTVFTFTGSGFSSLATTCNARIWPPFPGGSNPGCYISAGTGQVSGSVVVPTNAAPGTYGIIVSEFAGGVNNSATGVFTVGTPSALIVLNPASVSQGQPVGVAGFGFNPNDTFCLISASSGQSPPGPPFASTPTCAISGGYVSGSFLVANDAPGGYYLITVTGYNAGTGNATRGDFASNFLGVTLTTTATTGTTTTTTAATTTSVAFTTTSVATSFSYSSTTFSTTGILFTTYSHITQTTVSGQTTTTQTQTTSTTQTQTTVTVSTTTQFTTVPCGPLPCGFAMKPQSIDLGPGVDSAGLLAALLLLVPMLLRRLFT
jgi:hypothetical protein